MCLPGSLLDSSAHPNIGWTGCQCETEGCVSFSGKLALRNEQPLCACACVCVRAAICIRCMKKTSLKTIIQ